LNFRAGGIIGSRRDANRFVGADYPEP
jgi:hypothetical protein